MRYLVCRTDAVRNYNRRMPIKQSCFPIEVETSYSDAEAIVRLAFDTIHEGYVGMHSYLVISLDEAKIVEFKPRQSYDVDIRPYV